MSRLATRIRRVLFTIVSAVTLLLCVAIGVLWVRGDRIEAIQARYVRWPQPDKTHWVTLQAASYSGTTRFVIARADFDRLYFDRPSCDGGLFRRAFPPGTHWEAYSERMNGRRPLSYAPDFHAAHEVASNINGYRGEQWMLGVPHWFAMALLLAAPAVRGYRVLRARSAARAGLCAACGYDLRATPDCCPECGTAAVTTAEGYS